MAARPKWEKRLLKIRNSPCIKCKVLQAINGVLLETAKLKEETHDVFIVKRCHSLENKLLLLFDFLYNE